MKNKWITYLLASVVFLLCMAMTCVRDWDEFAPIDIVDVDVVVLDNSGYGPKPADGKPIPRKAVMLEFVYDVIDSETGKSPKIKAEGGDYSKLNDAVLSIRVVSVNKLFDDEKESDDITFLFSSSSPNGQNLTRYAMDTYIYNGRDIYALLAEPCAGQHQFEVSVTFKSGRVVIKTVNLELK